MPLPAPALAADGELRRSSAGTPSTEVCCEAFRRSTERGTCPLLQSPVGSSAELAPAQADRSRLGR